MDTYGHLFPGQEADTVARFPNLLSNPLPRVMQATGTYDQMPQPEPERSDGAARRGREPAKHGEPRRNTAIPPNVLTSKRTTITLVPTSCQCPR